MKITMAVMRMVDCEACRIRLRSSVIATASHISNASPA
jgi:hypothetical protein